MFIKMQTPELLPTFTDIQAWGLSYRISKQLFTKKQKAASKGAPSSPLDSILPLGKSIAPLSSQSLTTSPKQYKNRSL